MDEEDFYRISELERKVEDLEYRNEKLQRILCGSLYREFLALPDYALQDRNKVLTDFVEAYPPIKIEVSLIHTCELLMRAKGTGIELELYGLSMLRGYREKLSVQLTEAKQSLDQTWHIDFVWEDKTKSFIEPDNK